MSSYKIGDCVIYYPIKGRRASSVGEIINILTKSKRLGQLRPVKVKASESEPKYVIKNLKTGKRTAYMKYNIERLANDKEVLKKKSIKEYQSNHSKETIINANGEEPPHHGVAIK